MAVKAKTQITVFDMTDAYSVILTSEAFTFAGNTSGAPAGLSCSTQAVAYCGGMQCKKVTIGKKDIGVVGNMWFGQENGILFVTLNDGTILEAINLFDENNLSIGWGHYSQKKGQVCIGGTDIIHRVSATANNVEYRPYYRRGDSIDVRMGTAVYVTSGTKEFYFTIPLGKPVVGNPSVSISSINGLIMRQNSKYIIKADWVQPDRYSAAVSDNNAIWVIAFWNNTTNAANNSPVGIDANIRITFS